MFPSMLVRDSLSAALAVSLLAFGASAGAQDPAEGEEALNMRLVGYSDLQGRSAYQPIIQRQGDRWIAYIGHHAGSGRNPLTGTDEGNGTSVVDVTDPQNPRYVAHIPGDPAKGAESEAQMVRTCSGSDLPEGVDGSMYLLRAVGRSGHDIWDVTTPEQPVLVSEMERNVLRDTHKSWWECETGIAYLVSGVEGWAPRRMTQLYDLSNPAEPRFIRNFGLAGQQPGAPGHDEMVRYDLHGPIAVGNRIYFGYGTFLDGVVQIVDREKLLRGNPAVENPFEPTDENLNYPVITTMFTGPRLGAHTVFPVLGIEVPEFAANSEGRTRDMLLVVGESLRNECLENRQMMYMVDITDETRPWPVGNFQVPEASGSFCERGGRFGTHSSNENMTPIYYGRVVFLAYFNGGIRAVDIRDPWSPREIGHYIPAINERTTQRCINVEGAERCKKAIQTNNLEVDDRGYVYAVDRANTGLHIVELTGSAREVANFQ
ncbi:LVIVD repeat-containing protein [Candidatus Rariloculus sp.]|uniref:LVIVD repeat-containing protein n=1 Tax=Candidatus Rariloculus sp. TaxID=3101265 RepID=UPI003D14C644